MQVKRISEQLIEIDGHDWKKCKSKLSGQCSDCLVMYRAGKEVYRPMENVSFRSDRLCLKCVEKLLKPVTLDSRIEDL